MGNDLIKILFYVTTFISGVCGVHVGLDQLLGYHLLPNYESYAMVLNYIFGISGLICLVLLFLCCYDKKTLGHSRR